VQPEVPFSEGEMRNRLVRLVVRGGLPLSIVGLAEFRSYSNLLKPGVAIPSRNTVKSDSTKCYREKANRIGEQLRNAGSKISVTLDCWTSPNNKAFLGITGHYIDSGWKLRSLVLDFVPLSGSHTGANLCGAFVGTCERLGILDKLLGVTTDNASNNGKLLSYFEDFSRKRGITFDKEQQHVRCLAHIMNLAAQAFLGVRNQGYGGHYNWN